MTISVISIVGTYLCENKREEEIINVPYQRKSRRDIKRGGDL
jgi:hypothetical protein